MHCDAIPESTEQRDPVSQLANAPMTPFQWTAIAIVGLLYALDGFDVLAMSFAAPIIAPQWGISRAELGYALSAGLFGMAIGSLLLSPLADTVGRRRVVLGALGATTAGTLWTSVCADVVSLTLSRLLTGVGIGTMLGVISPLAAEYANARRRDLAVGLTSSCFGLGAVVGGLLSAWLLSSYSWRSIFYVASGVGTVMMILSAICLREPVSMVIARPGKNGLRRANDYLQRCGLPALERLPQPPPRVKVPFAALFGPEMIRDTLILAALYFFYVIPLFYMQTWLPALVVEVGLPSSQAAVVTASLSIGGVAGGLFVALTSSWIGLKRLEAILLGGAAVTMALFAFIPGQFSLLLPGAAMTGFFLMGSMVGIWAIIVRTFAIHLRASGTGFVLGVGRLSSALPPVLAGFLFTAGVGRVSVSLLMTAPLIASLVLLFALRIRPPQSY
jgi:MFS family permease